MVRKQLYLREDQDAALKRLARDRGVSEAQLVREAIDELVASSGSASSALEQFFAAAGKVSKRHQFPEGWRFNRDEANERR